MRPYFAVVQFDRSGQEYIARYFDRLGAPIRSEWVIGSRDDALLMAGRAGVQRVFRETVEMHAYITAALERRAHRTAVRVTEEIA